MTDQDTHQQSSATAISATWDQAADGSYTATVRVSGLASEEQAKGDVRRMREALSAPSCLSANPNAQPPHRPDDSCPDKACKMMGACMRAVQGNYPAAPDDWRPIETAPKDGTEILLGAPGRSTQGQWLEPSDKPVIKYRDGFAPEEEWEEFEPFWSSYDGGFTEEHPPTHWMPLPASPSPGAEGTIKQDLRVGGPT
jgi:hypothetical protein